MTSMYSGTWENLVERYRLPEGSREERFLGLGARGKGRSRQAQRWLICPPRQCGAAAPFES